MAKVGNETKLLLSLAKERAGEELAIWRQVSSNPNSNSHNPIWLAGYEYAHRFWIETLDGIIKEIQNN